MLTVDLPTARRFILGKQGLWPGRRWQGLEGAGQAMRAMEYLQLDPVSARGRAKVLFDFDYVWEVYKPEHKRKYGYYTLPILWGERLAARFDSRLDRANSTLIILRFWLEDDSLAANGAFTDALWRGFARFKTFLSAERLDASRIEEPRLRKHFVM